MPTPYIPNFHWYIPFYLGCNSLDNIFAAAFQLFSLFVYAVYTSVT
ncbi:Uncharacterised protein [Bacteroides thetaiotaomicron]|nr:Uncharacterised protein [Bacteroides thetaiotaomicron]